MRMGTMQTMQNVEEVYKGGPPPIILTPSFFYSLLPLPIAATQTKRPLSKLIQYVRQSRTCRPGPHFQRHCRARTCPRYGRRGRQARFVLWSGDLFLRRTRCMWMGELW